MLKLKAKDLIAPEHEAHFHYHKKFKYWTIEHSHDFYELFLVTGGTLIHIVNGEKQALPAGTLVFIRPHDRHSFEMFNNSDAELLNINFRVNVIQSVFRFLGEGLHPERLTESKLPLSSLLSTSETTYIMNKYMEITNIPIDRHAEIRTAVRAFLLHLIVSHFPPSPVIQNVPEWLNSILIQMQKKEMFSIGLSALNELSPVSPEHLCRVARKYFHRTPTEWINDIRLKYAAHLLRHSNEDILTVSIESGFTSLSHFYKLFHLRFQVSPAKYRKTNRRVVIPE